MQIRPANLDDIDAIICSNKKYLSCNLNNTDKKTGFIRIEYNIEELYLIIINKDCVVSENENGVIGYFDSVSSHYSRSY